MKFREKGSSANEKAGTKVAQTGTPVPAKDFSSKKKEAKAAGNGKPEKGSAAVAKSLPTESATSNPVPAPKDKWEGSSKDWSADYAAAKRSSSKRLCRTRLKRASGSQDSLPRFLAKTPVMTVRAGVCETSICKRGSCATRAAT